jgi:hypothetical protein
MPRLILPNGVSYEIVSSLSDPDLRVWQRKIGAFEVSQNRLVTDRKP